MKQEKPTYRLFVLLLFVLVTTSWFYQSQEVLIDEVKKEVANTDADDSEESQSELGTCQVVVMPSSVTCDHHKKIFILDIPVFPSECCFEVIQHNSKAFTTFFVKLFNHTIATKGP